MMCRYCRHCEMLPEGPWWCALHLRFVFADAVCARYEREPGADDDKAQDENETPTR
jgi:hypothetical protein